MNCLSSNKEEIQKNNKNIFENIGVGVFYKKYLNYYNIRYTLKL